MSPVEAWIRHIHAPGYSLKDEGKPTFVVSDTSRGGTATGLWTRPDITVASVRRYRYTKESLNKSEDSRLLRSSPW